MDDIDKEHCREMHLMKAEIQRLHQRVLEVERQRDNAFNRLREKIIWAKGENLYESVSSRFNSGMEV